MLRFAFAIALGVTTLVLVSGTRAEDKKEETKKLEGTLTCTKCALSETKACGHALIVKVDGKNVTYYLNDKGGDEKYHGACCRADVPAVVTGKVVEKDGKKTINEPKVEIKKEK